MPDVKTNNEAYLACSLNGGLAVDKNTGYRNVNLLIDIVVPDTKNVIKSDNYECQFSYRVYDLMYEIDKLLNNKISDYGIVNKIYYIGFQRRDYSDDIHGVQMTYNMQINSNVDFVS